MVPTVEKSKVKEKGRWEKVEETLSDFSGGKTGSLSPKCRATFVPGALGIRESVRPLLPDTWLESAPPPIPAPSVSSSSASPPLLPQGGLCSLPSLVWSGVQNHPQPVGMQWLNICEPCLPRIWSLRERERERERDVFKRQNGIRVVRLLQIRSPGRFLLANLRRFYRGGVETGWWGTARIETVDLMTPPASQDPRRPPDPYCSSH